MNVIENIRKFILKARDFFVLQYVRLSRTEVYKIVLIVLSIVLVGAGGTLFFERGTNEGLSNFFDSFWFIIVTMTTVGYGDRSPETVGGRAFGMVIMMIGVAMMGVVTGRIASFLVERQMRAGKGLIGMSKMENHFIICGWKKDLPNIIEDVMKVNPQLREEDIVLINRMDPSVIDDLKTNPKFAGVKFIYGDHSDENVLLRANIKKARTILILADTSDNATPMEIDSRTVMCALTAESLNRKIYTCAELLNSRFERHLEIGHVDEVILSQDYSRTLIANASSSTGVGHVINQLIDVDSDTPITVKDFPEEFIGKTYAELCEHFRGKDGSILIGVLENTGNLYQRKKEALKEAQKTPDISKLVQNLNQVKMLRGNDPVINPALDYVIKTNSKAVVIGRRARHESAV